MHFQFIKVKMKKKTRKGKIVNLSDHEKLINLISIHDEKDVNYLLRSVDQVFFEVFNFKTGQAQEFFGVGELHLYGYSNNWIR